MIRQMQTDDIAQVAAIEESVFSSPWSKKSFQDAIAHSQNIYLVAECDGEIAGYCGIWTSYENADLCNIVVKENFRRQGIAKQLLLEGMQKAKKIGVEHMILEVREHNVSAISLYQKIGFRDIGRRKEYYGKPVEDALLMQAELKNNVRDC